MTSPNKLVRIAAALAAAAWAALPAVAQTADSRDKLIRYLDGIALSQLQQRQRALAAIQTRAQAERRKAAVREKILRLLGGLPEKPGRVAVREFGTLSADGFHVDKIAYESQPGFWVTANVYVPDSGRGPFPAVVIAPGHGPAGKPENWNWGGNLARNGIVALSYDPLGQGERLQYFDPVRKLSFIGNPTGEHGEANIPPLLIGDDVARYMVNDGMRAIDYLTGRKDVDADRIGAFGCSGGGTATAYLAALDDRVKVAATACYITSFQELLPSATGVQEAEQSLPHFIEEGLDFADWVEAFAPKPYAIVSTTNDMFPFEGARQTYQEAKRIYALYGAEDRLHWFTGPGGHGALAPIAPSIVGLFTKALAGQDPSYTPLRLQHPEDLLCTPTGQVSTTFSAETVYSLNRRRAETLLPPSRPLGGKRDLARLQTRLRQDIRALTGARAEPGKTGSIVDIKSSEERAGYRLETVSLHSDADMEVAGFLAIPGGSGSKPAVLWMSSRPKEEMAAADSDLDRLARAGRIVLALEARPAGGAESIKSPYLGAYNLLALRAFLVGKTLVGLRADDAIRAIDWLSSRKDVNRSDITAYGSGPLGIVALHAAALDGRIAKAIVEDSLATLRMIVDQPVHRNVSEVVIPGVLRKYDTGDLMLAIYPRPITVGNPLDAAEAPVAETEFRKALAYVFESDRNLGAPQRIRVIAPGTRDRLASIYQLVR